MPRCKKAQSKLTQIHGTAVSVFQPELQKQAAEREGKNVEEFQQTHGGAMYVLFFLYLPPLSHYCPSFFQQLTSFSFLF
jgi:hypothetical protein